MRVTESARFGMLRHELTRTSGRLAAVTEQLSTGRSINRLSDDPELAVAADRLRTEDQALVAYGEAADNARAWLGSQDGALQSALSVLRRARELTIAAGTPNNDAGRNGIAAELEGIRSQLIDIANTRFNGRPIFGGFGATAVEETAGTVTFSGDTGAVQRRIGEDRVIQVNISGSEAFGFGAGEDIFAVLANIGDHVRSDDVASITGVDLDLLERAADRLGESLGSVGAAENVVQNTLGVAGARRDEIRAYRSSIVDTDIAETALELTLAETAYESVLAATARLQLPNLVDYLR